MHTYSSSSQYGKWIRNGFVSGCIPIRSLMMFDFEGNTNFEHFCEYIFKGVQESLKVFSWNESLSKSCSLSSLLVLSSLFAFIYLDEEEKKKILGTVCIFVGVVINFVVAWLSRTAQQTTKGNDSTKTKRIIEGIASFLSSVDKHIAKTTRRRKKNIHFPFVCKQSAARNEVTVHVSRSFVWYNFRHCHMAEMYT